MWPLASLVVRSAWDTAKRFPGPLVAAIVTSGLLIEAQHRDFRGQDPLMSVMAAVLGIPLGTALTLIMERPPRFLAKVPARPLVAFSITLVLTLLYALVLEGARGQGEAYVLRYAQLSLAAHLAVAFAPFLGTRQGMSQAEVTRGVWQLGRQLFLRFPLSAVYAAVVFGGLALALAAVVHLFGVHVHEDRYFELWVVCAFVLMTWIFLAGVPRDFDALARDDAYPKGLRVFAQFVLLPLLGLYLLILYAYLAKIVFSGTLPNGWVGWMVSAAGAFGMLALLLLFPAREGTAGRFLRGVEIGFHLAILPLLGLLFVSLAVRVDAYGITERRYFLFVLGLWLAAASVYRLRWGRHTLAWIPVSLCLVALATSLGPWGALAVSRESQTARLTALLRKNERINGPATEGKAASFADEREMSRILDYLVETHGEKMLTRWPGPALASPTAASFLRVRGLDYVEQYGTEVDTLSFYGKHDAAVAVTGYDWLIPFQLYEHSDRAPTGARYSLSLSQSSGSIEVSEGTTLRGKVPLGTVLEQLEKDESRPKGEAAPIHLSAESGGLRFHLVLTQLHAERRGEQWALMSCTGSLLIGK